MKLFDYDGPIMSFLTRIFDLVFLNVLTLIFSIPIITIGATMTATYYTALKLHRNEGHVWKSFLKSFKENLRQSTAIWLLFIISCAVSVMTYNIGIHMSGTFSTVIRGIVLTTMILIVLLYVWVLPLQSRFINPIRITFKNAFYLAFKYIFRTLIMVVLNLLPIGTFVVVIYWIGMRAMGVWLLFGIAVPIYWCVMIYDKVFEKLEELI